MGNAPTSTLLAAEELHTAIAELLAVPADELDDETDLITAGLDSLQIMRLASKWRAQGADVSYADLVADTTMRAWRRVLSLEAATGADEAHTPRRGDSPTRFQLTPMQEAYWLGRRAGTPFGGVGSHYYVEFDGEGVDPGALDAALRAVIARHDMLRARFGDDGRQEVRPRSPWTGVSIRDHRGADTAAALERLRDEMMHRPLDVGRGEVLDVALSLLPGGRTRVHVTIDMLVADASSFRLLLDDLAALYRDPSAPQSQLGVTFGEHVQARWPEGTRRGGGRDDHYVDGLPSAPALPLAAAPVPADGHRFERRDSFVAGAGVEALTTVARRHGVTTASVILTAFAETLAAWSAEPRFLLTIPAFDREPIHPDIDRVVGDFTRLLVVDFDLSAPATFRERARDVQRRVHRAIANRDESGLDLLRELGRRRPGAMSSPVVFTTTIGMGDLFGPDVRDTLGAPGWTSSQTPQVWLDCQVTERDGGLCIGWDVVEGIFRPGVTDAMFGAFVGLVARLADGTVEWDAPLGSLMPGAQANVRRRANDDDRPAPTRLLHDGLFRHARDHGEDIAVITEDGDTLTYAGLADRARRLASQLRCAGVRPRDTVAITLPRGAEQVVAVAGALFAGATYVPVELDHPAARRESTYRSAGAAVVVTTEQVAAELEPSRIAVVPNDEMDPLEHDVARVAPADAAYVIFTSGSTGEPKGVEMSHAAALNTVAAVNDGYGVGRADRVLALSALGFDLSVFDLFGLLSAGGALMVPSEESRRDPRRWAALMAHTGVTIWNSVPSSLDMLLAVAADDAFGSMRLALISGDRIAADLPSRLRSRAPECRFVALGGATEAAIWSNCFEVTSSTCLPADCASIPYGRPLPNQRFRAVDARGNDCPDWVAGELWIGGAGVAMGYRGRPDLTQQSFVTHEGSRWYRTGDIGRYWSDGTIEHLGRRDRQVKVRGHRVELGEIEAAILDHPDVAACVALVLPDPSPALAAAIVPAPPSDGVPDGLRELLRNRLAPYQVPTRYLALRALPLTANGKVDAAAIPPLFAAEPCSTERRAPLSPLEEELARLWADLLRIAQPGPADSFFELGGDSLVAATLVAELEARYGVDVSFRDLIEAPTVSALAGLVAAAAEAPAMEEGVV